MNTIKELAEEWAATATPGFGQRALEALSAKCALSSKKVFISKLRQACLAVGRLPPDFKEPAEAPEEWQALFNQEVPDLRALVKLQAKWRKEASHPELTNLNLVHPELRVIRLTEEEATKLDQTASAQKEAKIMTVTSFKEADLKRILHQCDEIGDWAQLVIALLLATGRRTIEILKTACFREVDDFKVMFSGQAKAGCEERKAYIIDTLISASSVVRALAHVRSKMDAGDMKLDNATVRNKYAYQLRRALNLLLPAANGNIHALRSINAVMSEKKFNADASPVGYMKKHLGHMSDSDTVRYQCVRIVYDWQSWGKPSKAKCEAIRNLITAEPKTILTVALVRKRLGGNAAMVEKIFAYNRILISEHNKQAQAIAN